MIRRVPAILLLALVLAPLSSAATKQPIFGLRAVGNPKLGYFVYPLTPGSVQQGGVIISNSGNATGTVKLFAADATTGRTTGTVYLTDRKPSRVGSWISLSSTSLTLKPGQDETVHFTVRVPSNAKPGQWVGGVVAETSRLAPGPKTKRKASVQIRIRNLTIVAVQVNIPGPPLVDFRIGAVKTGGQRGFQELVTHLENDGNLLVKPSGSVTVLNRQGRRIQILTFKMDTFLPQTAIDYPLLLKKALGPGDYSAIVRLSVSGSAGVPAKVVTAHPSFSISSQDVKQVFTSATPQTAPPAAAGSSSGSTTTPWALIGAGVGAVLLLALALLWFRRRRSATAPRPSTTVQGSTPTAAAAEEAPPADSLAERTEPPPVPPPLRPQPTAAPPEPRIESPLVEPSPPPVEPTAPVEPTPPSEPIAAYAPQRAARNPECDPHHFWEVAYDRGELGEDGVWRFPHRCRNCGLELLASDVSDATAQADSRA